MSRKILALVVALGIVVGLAWGNGPIRTTAEWCDTCPDATVVWRAW